MIPEFPNFKKLELEDREDVLNFTSPFPPYSDFNFTNLWSWNISEKMMLSQLHKNLVIVFTDYVTNESFVSFIGENKIAETASALLKFSNENYQVNSLKFIPEEMTKDLLSAGFNVRPDRDSYNYIYSISDMAGMDNWTQNTSSKKIRRFARKYPNYEVREEPAKELSSKHKDVFIRWVEGKNITTPFGLNEDKAFERFMKVGYDNIKVISLYIDQVMVGFTVYEILKNNYAVSHFAKADTKFDSGVYDILNWEEAKILKKKGIEYYNWEQDLGISGLRYSKMKYKPAFFLKQYIVSN